MRRPLFGGGLTLGIAGAILCASLSPAATLDPIRQTPTNSASLASGQTTTGASTNAVDASPNGRGFRSMVVEYTASDGSGDVKLQICCAMATASRVCTAEARWIDVANSSKTVNAAGTATDAVGLDNPQCLYRTNITSCTGCTISTTAYMGTRVAQ